MQAGFKIEYLVPDIDIKEITAEVRGPSGQVECLLNLSPTGGTGSFIPTEVGMHEVRMGFSRDLKINEGNICTAQMAVVQPQCPPLLRIVSDGVSFDSELAMNESFHLNGQFIANSFTERPFTFLFSHFVSFV